MKLVIYIITYYYYYYCILDIKVPYIWELNDWQLRNN